MHTTTISHAMLAKAPSTPPSEFRIFKAGVNETTKGTFLFDAKAAQDVMAAYERYGAIDLPLDLEHESLEATAARADSKDARGWFKLALRGGELWAVDVRWTPDGARRLAERTQKFISPAFVVGEDGRPREIVNVALVAAPAMHGAQPLAASRFGTRTSTMVGARVTTAQAKAFYALAKSAGVAPGVLLRSIVRLAIAHKSETLFSDLAKVLGLPGDTDPREVAAAVSALLDEFEAPTKDMTPTQEVAEAPPPPPALSKAQLAACKLAGVSANEFRQRRAGVVRAAPRKAPAAPATRKLTRATLTEKQLAACRKANITPEDFLARRSGVRFDRK